MATRGSTEHNGDMFEESPYDHLSPDLLAERQALIGETFEAFEDVSREGGVSWIEAQLLDRFASPEECQAAREQDRETWQELLADPSWSAEGFEFCYLDPIGFAYYLPAGMIRSIQAGFDQEVGFILSLPNRDEYWGNRFEDFRRPMTLRQATVVKRFLHYMANICPDDDRWSTALQRGWEFVGDG